MCMRIDGHEAYTIFEERRNGVTIGGVISYFNRHLKDFLHACGITDDFYVRACLSVQCKAYLEGSLQKGLLLTESVYMEKI